MQDDVMKPDDAGLRTLLQDSRPSPELPPGFARGVWRRLQRDEQRDVTSSARSWIDRLVERLLSPRIAFGGIAAALAVGIVIGTVQTSSLSRQMARDRYFSLVAPHHVR